MDIITVNNLTKEYITYSRGSGMSETIKSLFIRKKVVIKAVNNISFTVKRGEIVGMLGPNGAGKSTTIKMLTGILTPTNGNIDVLGFDPQKHRTKYVSHIGAMFGQKSQLIWDIPPVDSFLMNKAIYDIDDNNYKERLDMLVSLLGASEIITKPTRVLSLGERMKCEFIIAMLHNPQVVFLDEPTIGIDVIAKDNIRKFIKDMNRQGVTFILTTHDLGDIESLAHSTVIIDKGEIVFNGTISELKHYLGNKKTVTFSTKLPFEKEFLNINGLSLIGEDEGKIIITVDLDKLTINDLISFINSHTEITDLSINEPKMEEIVKAIYNK